MKKYLVLFILSGLFSYAFADTAELNDDPNNIVTQINNSLSFYVAGQHIDYKEYADSRVVDSQKGNLPGFIVELNKSIGGLVLTFDANYFQGSLTYDGSTWGGTPLSFEGKHTVYGYSWQLAYPFAVQNNLILGPVAKIGYREWDRNTDAASHPGDYEEAYMNYYAQLGFDLGAMVNDSFYIDNTLLFGSTFNARMAPSAMPLGYQAPMFNLGSEPIFTDKLQANYAPFSNLLLKAFVQFNMFSFGQSKDYLVGYDQQGNPVNLHEPHSTTTDTTLGLGVGYSFAGI